MIPIFFADAKILDTLGEAVFKIPGDRIEYLNQELVDPIMKLRTFVLLTWLCVQTFTFSAQPANVKFDHLGTTTGLSHGNVITILQTVRASCGLARAMASTNTTATTSPFTRTIRRNRQRW